METRLLIYWGAEKAADYNQAIEYASMFKKFSPIGNESTRNKIETDNLEVLEKYDLLQKLMNVITGWKSTGISYNNKKVDPHTFFWNTKEIVRCYQGYNQSEQKAVYCSEGGSDCWGCRLLSGIVHKHTEAPYKNQEKYWYQFGEFADKTTWVLNKEQLSMALAEIVEKKSIEFCPAFQLVFYRKLVAELPAKIDVLDTENWGQVYLDTSISNVKSWEAINVYHKSTQIVQPKVRKPVYKKPETGTTDSKYIRYVPATSFDDIGGIEEIITSIREVIELPLKRPDLYEHLGIRPYRGIMLWGEPGNGKTLIAKAIAHEVKAHFIPLDGPDILNKSFGESEKNLRNLFEEAREMQPSIIFIDEIDAIAQSRLAGETSKWYATVVNQLLSLMDGIKEFGNVSVLASTNRPDLLDPALLRPGRFDYKLEVKAPNLLACKKILEIATVGMPLANDVDFFTFAESIIGFSAADIVFIAKEAALIAVRRNVDINSIIMDEEIEFDFNKVQVKQSDFYGALIVLKRNAKYTSKTYSLKG